MFFQSPGILREASKGRRRVYEPDGMGSRHSREAERKYNIERVMTSVVAVWCAIMPDIDVEMDQTPWEGGLYKLVMSFPEGRAFDTDEKSFLMHLHADYPSKPPKCWCRISFILHLSLPA